jgi:hypothetical protein
MTKFNFAGSIIEGEFLCKSKLNDGTIIYKFEDEQGFIYPVKKEDICGNFKQ